MGYCESQEYMDNINPTSGNCTFDGVEVDCDWYTCFQQQKDSKWPYLEYIFIPSGMHFYSGGAAAKQNLEYPLTDGWYDPTKKLTTDQTEALSREGSRDSQHALELFLQFSGEKDISIFGSHKLALKYSQMSGGCGVNCIASYVVRKNGENGIKIINLFSPWNLFIFVGLDPENIDKSFKNESGRASNLLGFSKEEKIYLLASYGITEANIKEKIQKIDGKWTFTNPTRKSLRNDPNYVKLGHPYLPNHVRYFVLKRIRRITQKLGYAGCMYPMVINQDKKPALPELILFDCIKTLGRDTYDPLDWQYTYAGLDNTAIITFRASEVHRLITHMKEYKTLYLDFHSGNLYAHSAWVALYLQEMFHQMINLKRKNVEYNRLAETHKKYRLLMYESYINNTDITESLREDYDNVNRVIENILVGDSSRLVKWVDGIPDNYLDIVPIAGFFHDIGKCGDNTPIYTVKPDHTSRGSKYLNKKLAIYITNEPNINIDLLLDELNIDPRESSTNYSRALLICSSALHWDFGMTVKHLVRTKDISDKLMLIHEYILAIIKCFYKTGIRLSGASGLEKFRELLLSIIIISVSDVLATQPYIGYTIFDKNRRELEEIGCWKHNHATSYKNDVCFEKRNLNALIDKYPFITNYPKSQRGGLKFSDFKTNTLGYRVMRLILYEYDNRSEYYYTMKTIGLIY